VLDRLIICFPSNMWLSFDTQASYEHTAFIVILGPFSSLIPIIFARSFQSFTTSLPALSWRPPPWWIQRCCFRRPGLGTRPPRARRTPSPSRARSWSSLPWCPWALHQLPRMSSWYVESFVPSRARRRRHHQRWLLYLYKRMSSALAMLDRRAKHFNKSHECGGLRTWCIPNRIALLALAVVLKGVDGFWGTSHVTALRDELGPILDQCFCLVPGYFVLSRTW